MRPRLAAVAADSGPVIVLAGIAAAGSFTHIRDTADQHGQHGWMAWAIAVCIDLTCVMAARERQRDRRLRRLVRSLSWPTVVLVGGILLSLAANLAQAEPTPWGWLTAGTPAGAFLVAVSMLERRSSAREPAAASPSPTVTTTSSPAPPSFGRPSPALASVPDGQDDDAHPRTNPLRRVTRPPNCSPSRAASRTNTRPATDGRSRGTRSAPGSASPTNSPQTCSTRSAPPEREPP